MRGTRVFPSPLVWVSLIVVVCCLCAPAGAVDSWWQYDGVANWDDDSRWSAGEPTTSIGAIVDVGTPWITQDGEVADKLRIGMNAGTEAMVWQLSGTFTLRNETLGGLGIGTFKQSDGFHHVYYQGLTLATGAGSLGTYEMVGGRLKVDRDVRIGLGGSGCIHQTGGSVDADSIFVGASAGGPGGQYRISGGSLNVDTFSIGYETTGGLSIESAGAYIEVENILRLCEHGTFTAVPGATIHMTGSDYWIWGTDPTKMPGLGDLELIFEGGPAPLDAFELACEDLGATPAGFVDNFALDVLRIGQADVGRIYFVDSFDNSPGAECLYVRSLILGPGSEFDLRGKTVYCGTFTDLGGTVVTGGGQIIPGVPEPATIVLLASGAAALLRRRRRR